MQLSVVITTFNRPDLLKICLDSLSKQTAATDRYEIIVIDNAGDDACARIVSDYPARYVYEPQTGHSYARNRGLREAGSEWVLYLDDDTILPPHLIHDFLAYLPKVTGAAFGGRFDHWYLDSPPAWLVQQQGIGAFPGQSAEFGVLPEDEYLIGCFFAVKVAPVLSLGGFDPEFGMQGKEVGWADEVELQYRLRHHGHKVYYAPELVIKHLVQPWKCSLRGQLRFAYSHGKKSWANPHTAGKERWALIGSWLRITFVTLPFTLMRWLLKHREWYWQNVFLRVGTKYAFAVGRHIRRWKVTTT